MRYQGEMIVASRIGPSGKKYLVKWKGWTEDQNSWEPADNVDAKEEVEIYEKLREGK